MNILVIGKFYTEGFALHIAETLTVMGHDVRRFEPGARTGRIGGRFGHRCDQIYGALYTTSDNLPAVRRHRMKKLWRVAEDGPLDLVIVCHDFLWPAEVEELKRRTSARVAMWFPDALVNFGRSFFMNAPYDALFFKDPYIIHILGDVLQSPVYYLPECFNPARHVLPEGDTSVSNEYACDLTTAGNSHSYRVAFFMHLKAYDVKLWGKSAPLWMPTGPVKQMHQGRGVYNQDKARAFRGAKIVVSNLHYGEIWGVNARTFEIAGIGGFQLIDWRPGLSQLFAEGKEIVAFRGIDDLRNKIDYYLANPGEREKIARNGQQRAMAEHTYKDRLQLLLDTLHLQAKGYTLPVVKMMDDQ